MGQPLIVQEISCLVRQFCPKIVFLSETRQQNNRVNNLRFRLGFRNSFVVDGHGKGGGLVLYWDESIKLNVLSYGQHHIDTGIVTTRQVGMPCLCMESHVLQLIM
jgi:hypothetical protein